MDYKIGVDPFSTAFLDRDTRSEIQGSLQLVTASDILFWLYTQV